MSVPGKSVRSSFMHATSIFRFQALLTGKFTGSELCFTTPATHWQFLPPAASPASRSARRPRCTAPGGKRGKWKKGPGSGFSTTLIFPAPHRKLYLRRVRAAFPAAWLHAVARSSSRCVHRTAHYPKAGSGPAPAGYHASKTSGCDD